MGEIDEVADDSNGSTHSRTALILEEKPMCRAAIARVVIGVGGFAPPIFASSLAEASRALDEGRPDVVLVDLFTIGYDFLGLEDFVRRHNPISVVAIDDRLNPSFAKLARDTGARGYACKSFEIELFEAIVAAVAAGRMHFPQPLIDSPRAPVARSVGRLSPRQLEVLKCIAVGMGNQEIADKLGITLGTAKVHAHTILKLTGARNRTEAALIAGRFLVPRIEKA